MPQLFDQKQNSSDGSELKSQLRSLQEMGVVQLLLRGTIKGQNTENDITEPASTWSDFLWHLMRINERLRGVAGAAQSSTAEKSQKTFLADCRMITWLETHGLLAKYVSGVRLRQQDFRRFEELSSTSLLQSSTGFDLASSSAPRPNTGTFSLLSAFVVTRDEVVHAAGSTLLLMDVARLLTGKRVPGIVRAARSTGSTTDMMRRNLGAFSMHVQKYHPEAFRQMSRRKLTNHILRGNAPVVMSTLQTLIQHIGNPSNNSLKPRRVIDQTHETLHQQKESARNLPGKKVHMSAVSASKQDSPVPSSSLQSAQRCFIPESAASLLTPKQRVLQQQRWRAQQRIAEVQAKSERHAWDPRSPLHELPRSSGFPAREHHHKRAGHANANAAAEISMCIREMEESANLSAFEDYVDDFSFNSPAAVKHTAEVASDAPSVGWWASPPVQQRQAQVDNLSAQSPKASNTMQVQVQVKRDEPTNHQQEKLLRFLEKSVHESRRMSRGINESKPATLAKVSPVDPKQERPLSTQSDAESLQERDRAGHKTGHGGRERDTKQEQNRPKGIGVGGWLQKLGIPLGPVNELVGERDQDGGAMFVYPAWRDGVRLCTLLERLDVSIRNGIRGVQRPPKGPAVRCRIIVCVLLRCEMGRVAVSFAL